MLKLSNKLRRIIVIPFVILLVGSWVEEFTSLDFFSFSDEINFKLIMLFSIGMIFSIIPSPKERQMETRKHKNLTDDTHNM